MDTVRVLAIPLCGHLAVTRNTDFGNALIHCTLEFRGDPDMCLALPVRVVELKDGDRAVVDLGGVRKEVSLALVEGVAVDDYVILHVGYALTRLDPAEAERTLATFAAAGLAEPAGA
jgi:hydrogenase expression/formation protein HypC